MSGRKKQRIVKEERILGDAPTGLNNNFVIEEYARPRMTNSQNIIKGQNNSFVCFGRDKHAGRASGAGGRGYTQCGAIDIVAGLDSSNKIHDIKLAKSLFTRLQVGALNLNDGPGFRADHFPFTGIKESGIGSEGTRYTIDSMTYRKTLII